MTKRSRSAQCARRMRAGVLGAVYAVDCTPAIDRRGEAPTMRDSSGVRIVENHVDAWSATGTLAMSERPMLQFALDVEALPAAIGAAASVRAHTIIAVTPGGRSFAAGSNAPPADGGVRGKSVLVRYDSAGRGVLLGDAYPGTDMYYQPNDKSGFAFFAPPNGRSLAWAGVGDLLVAAHNETLEVRWLNANGDIVRIARAPQSNRDVTKAVQDEMMSDLRRRKPRARPDAEARWRAEQFMYNTVPAFGEMVVGADGRIWLCMDPPTPGQQTVRWAVLDSSGTLIGALEVAKALRLAWAGANDVLLVGSDTLRGGDSLFVHSLTTMGQAR